MENNEQKKAERIYKDKYGTENIHGAVKVLSIIESTEIERILYLKHCNTCGAFYESLRASSLTCSNLCGAKFTRKVKIQGIPIFTKNNVKGPGAELEKAFLSRAGKLHQ